METVTDWEAKLRDLTTGQAARRKFIENASKIDLGALALRDPPAYEDTQRQIADERAALTRDDMAISAAQRSLAVAKKRERREAAERQRAELAAEAAQVKAVLVPRIAKKIASLAPDLDALKAHIGRTNSFNREEARDFGLQPVVDGERQGRTIPGRTEPGFTTYREEWHLQGRPYVGVFMKDDASGELRPVHPAVKVRVPEIVPAREIEPRCAPSYVDTVKLAGPMPGDAPLWPKVVG